MRLIPSELQSRLDAGVTTLAHVWRVTRADGAVFGFTDHDAPLTFMGVPCAPESALIGGVLEKSVGLAIDNASIGGALNADAIAEEELARGLWDGARADLYKVDWTAPALFVHLFAGRFGQAQRGASGFEIELRGLQAPLNKPVGRVFSRFCDADVGDARCGADLTAGLYRGNGVVTEALSTRAFSASGLGAYANGWFARGVVIWDEGGTSEVAAHRTSADGAVLELVEPPGFALASGQTFAVTAGCDKRLATCHAKFANLVNFRGFPHMPGNDAVQAGPAESGNDGGSRLQ